MYVNDSGNQFPLELGLVTCFTREKNVTHLEYYIEVGRKYR